jgi:hypothetical protein
VIIGRLNYLPSWQPVEGLHVGIGPISAELKVAATVTYVQAKPTIRINILTACFMVFLLNADPLGAGILLAVNYIGSVNRFCELKAFKRQRDLTEMTIRGS